MGYIEDGDEEEEKKGTKRFRNEAYYLKGKKNKKTRKRSLSEDFSGQSGDQDKATVATITLNRKRGHVLAPNVLRFPSYSRALAYIM